MTAALFYFSGGRSLFNKFKWAAAQIVYIASKSHSLDIVAIEVIENGRAAGKFHILNSLSFVCSLIYFIYSNYKPYRRYSLD